MPDGRIPKDLLYGKLASGSHAQGRPHQGRMQTRHEGAQARPQQLGAGCRRQKQVEEGAASGSPNWRNQTPTGRNQQTRSL